MLVFSSARLVFLSVPKTGSTAYEAALSPVASMVVSAPPELKHAPVFRYNRFFRPALEKFIGHDLEVLAVMREPLDWLGSWYRFRKRPALRDQSNSTGDVTFDEFVDAYMKGQKPPFADVGSQAKFLEPQNNGTAVTHLFRYEDQQGLRAFLRNRLDVTVQPDRINCSPAEELALSDRTRQRFERKFANEYKLYASIREGGAYTALPRE